MAKDLWVDLYRPKTVDEIILPKEIKKLFIDQINDGKLQNMMLCGDPGTGKTSTAFALCDILGLTSLYVNASKERGIDVIRNDIMTFTSNMSLSDKGSHRVVILDEADMLTMEAQKALKGVIEETGWICRYLFTTNDPNKLIDAISDSRLVRIDFNFDRNQKNEMYPLVLKRMCEILDLNNIKYSKNHVKDLIISTLPDLRQIISRLEMYSKSGEFQYSKYVESKSLINELIDIVIVEKNFIKLYTWIHDNQHIRSSDLIDRFYVGYCERQGKPTESVARLASVISDYNWKLSLVKNPNITLTALFCDIMENDNIRE